METQNPENEKNKNTDQVVIIMDTKHKQTSQAADLDDPIPQTSAKTLGRNCLNFYKPKSRFEEINYAALIPPKTIYESEELLPLNPYEDTSSTDDDDYEEWYGTEEEKQEQERGNKVQSKYGRKKRTKVIKKRPLIEWSLFFIIMTCLICSLTLKFLKDEGRWGIKIWKWCLIVMVIFCGRLISGWVITFLIFLIERNFMLREKILYFVYGLRRSFQNCVWLGLVLIAWIIMFPNVHKHNKVQKKLFRALISILVGATIWLIKILLVKVLASSFHVATFFDRMRESVFHHYVLDTLSGPPLDEEERELMCTHDRRILKGSTSLPVRWRDGLSKSGSSWKIDMEKLRKLSTEQRASAWTVKRLVNHVMSSGLSTISRTVDDFGKAESEITSEWEARTCAQRIFKNVAKPGAKYIEEADLMRFLKSKEVYTIFPLIEGAIESGRITKSSFRNWVLHAYIERKSLALSLNDTKMATHQLHRLASALVTVIIIVVSLLVMGLATTKVILVVTSQLLLVGFMFQNTCKTIFESIIFVFVMHPFDVGDRCVVEGVQMTVEEMNILNTVFLRYDMEKIYYPNSVLLTKPISNFRRSPDMGDGVDFSIDVCTSVDNVTALKKAIQIYIESKPKHWSPNHCVIVNEIENLNSMKMSLCVQHTMNHQDFGEKSTRRSELVFELKKIFENLNIKYHVLPQEVHLTQANIGNGGMLNQS